jgi:hypothetical protein
LYPCSHCSKKIFLAANILTNHQKEFCTTIRSNTKEGDNITKACNTFTNKIPNRQAWEATLKFFTTDELATKPVPIRRAMFDKLNPGMKVQFFDIYESIMTLAATAPLTATDPRGKDWKDTATPFIIMAFYLPAMILVPLEKDHDESISSRIHERIQRLQHDEGKQLLEEVHATKCWTPLEKRQRAEEVGTDTTKAAQSAADSGHLSGCMKQILNSFPPRSFHTG